MEIITGGVTAAKGFMAAGVEAGIKYQNRKDMAMVYSKTPCRAAGVFTTNVVKAAPVLWDKEVVESEWEAQAIVVNSGIANACTGKLGYEYCRETAGAAADALEIPLYQYLVCPVKLQKHPVELRLLQHVHSQNFPDDPVIHMLHGASDTKSLIAVFSVS